MSLDHGLFICEAMDRQPTGSPFLKIHSRKKKADLLSELKKLKFTPMSELDSPVAASRVGRTSLR